MSDRTALWAEHDAQHALHDADHEVIAATEALRSLILDLLATGADRDLFNACARLGGLLATGSASPSLAANTLDGALHALATTGTPFAPSRVPPARASVLEGYVAGARETERVMGAARWEYPACAVPLPDGSVAIACGHPIDDAEALADWAGRVVGQLVKAKVRRVVLAGSPRARSEIASAANLVGITIAGDVEATPAASASASDPAATPASAEAPPLPLPRKKSGWLRLP